MPAAEIITIGTELLLGQLVDTNTAAISSGLAEIGIDVFRQTSVGDNQRRVAQALSEALQRCDAVLVAGGLGPTVDDLTRDAIAEAANRELETNQAALEEVRAWFARVQRTMSENNARQATFPRGAVVLENPHGTAPGFALELGPKIIIALPGPPREMEPMLRNHALPLLQKKFGLNATMVTRVLRTAGVSESEIDRRIQDLFRNSTNPSIAVLAHLGQVDVKLTAKAESRERAVALIDALEPVVRARLGDDVFSSTGEPLAASLGAALRARNWTIATAESCTGGAVGAMITAVPGASDYYCGGVVAYSDQSKIDLLNLAPEDIERYGAVSEEVAIAMAIGIRERLHATLGVSITGVAGPGGGSEEKPVGLIYIGVAEQDGKVEVKRRQIPGGREAVQHRAAVSALLLALRAARA